MRHGTLQSITKYSIDALCCTSLMWWLQCIRAVEHDTHRTADKTNHSPSPSHYRPEDAWPSYRSVSLPSSSLQQNKRVLPHCPEENTPTSSERTHQSRSSQTLNHLRKLLQLGPHICSNKARLCSRLHILQANMSPCSSRKSCRPKNLQLRITLIA